MRKVALQRFFSNKLLNHCFLWWYLCICVHELFVSIKYQSSGLLFFPHRQESFVHPTDHELFESSVCRPSGTKYDNVFIVLQRETSRSYHPALFSPVTFCFSSWGDLRLCQRHSKSQASNQRHPRWWGHLSGGPLTVDKMLMIDWCVLQTLEVDQFRLHFLMPCKGFQIVPICAAQVATVSYILSVEAADNDDLLICPKWDKVNVQ